MGKHETGYERVERDFYRTPEWATQALLDHIDIRGLRIWEPACGDGAMSEVLKAAGARVFSTDVVDRGYAGLDRLLDYTGPHPKKLPSFAGVITNPPYGLRGALTVEFIEVALRNLGDGFCAFLLAMDHDSAKTRASLYDHPQFAAKIVLRRRCKWFDTPGSASPKENHAWHMWGNVPFRPIANRSPVIRYAPVQNAIGSAR